MTTASKVALTILALCMLPANIYAVARNTSIYRQKVKLDLIPLYYLMFDVRQQLRLGAEYERMLGTRTFATIQSDAGLYDNYTYKKYQGFFDQAGGVDNTTQQVRTLGFHLLPSFSYILSNTTRHQNRKIYIGISADFNRFFKKSVITEAQASNTILSAQTKLGAGVNVGIQYRIKKRWYIDLKGIFIRRLFSINSQKDMKDIKPYKAIWFNKAMTSWFIPDLNICYAF